MFIQDPSPTPTGVKLKVSWPNSSCFGQIHFQPFLCTIRLILDVHHPDISQPMVPEAKYTESPLV